MHDVLPADSGLWRHLEDIVQDVLDGYGYREIRVPVMEKTELFSRSIGEVTDIVEKEMYTFEDRNGDSLTLRPEATAGCVRAGVEHGLFHNQEQRVWYRGPMFRHERPQKGRYRQFHQVGAEVFGLAGPDVDVELMLISRAFWQRLGLEENVELHLNTLGNADERANHREELVRFLVRHAERLDAASCERIHSNPMRVLDSKSAQTREVLLEAPRLWDFLGEASRVHFEGVQYMLEAAGVSFTLNHSLVRGLDYYTRTVFEWVTRDLGAQGTVCGGGRYDGLVGLLGGRETPAAGFAMGLERLVLLLQQKGVAADDAPHVYLVSAADTARAQALVLAEALRAALPALRVQTHCGEGGFKAQFRRADRSGAHYALVVGEEEAQRGEVSVKPLRGGGSQQTVAREGLIERLRQLLSLRAGAPRVAGDGNISSESEHG